MKVRTVDQKEWRFGLPKTYYAWFVWAPMAEAVRRDCAVYASTEGRADGGLGGLSWSLGLWVRRRVGDDRDLAHGLLR